MHERLIKLHDDIDRFYRQRKHYPDLIEISPDYYQFCMANSSDQVVFIPYNKPPKTLIGFPFKVNPDINEFKLTYEGKTLDEINSVPTVNIKHVKPNRTYGMLPWQWIPNGDSE